MSSSNEIRLFRRHDDDSERSALWQPPSQRQEQRNKAAAVYGQPAVDSRLITAATTQLSARRQYTGHIVGLNSAINSYLEERLVASYEQPTSTDEFHAAVVDALETQRTHILRRFKDQSSESDPQVEGPTDNDLVEISARLSERVSDEIGVIEWEALSAHGPIDTYLAARLLTDGDEVIPN